MLPQRQQPKPFLVTPRGYSLAWTDEDRLWLLRAVEAEGEPRPLVAQTLVNRFAWLWDTTPAKYLTLTELVRAYAQPVNPAWFPDGKAYLQTLPKLPEDQRAPALARAHARREHSARTRFSPGTVAAVDQALYGPITLPMGALHFAAPSVARPDLPVLVPSSSTSENTIYGDVSPGSARALYALSSPRGADNAPTRKAAVVVALFAFGLGVVLARR